MNSPTGVRWPVLSGKGHCHAELRVAHGDEIATEAFQRMHQSMVDCSARKAAIRETSVLAQLRSRTSIRMCGNHGFVHDDGDIVEALEMLQVRLGDDAMHDCILDWQDIPNGFAHASIQFHSDEWIERYRKDMFLALQWQKEWGQGRVSLDLLPVCHVHAGQGSLPRSGGNHRDDAVATSRLGSGFYRPAQDVGLPHRTRRDRPWLQQPGLGTLNQSRRDRGRRCAVACGARDTAPDGVLEGIEQAHDLALAQRAGGEWLQGHAIAMPAASEPAMQFFTKSFVRRKSKEQKENAKKDCRHHQRPHEFERIDRKFGDICFLFSQAHVRQF